MKRTFIALLILLFGADAYAAGSITLSSEKAARMRAAATELIWTRSILADRYASDDKLVTVETYKQIFGRGASLEDDIRKREGFDVRYATSNSDLLLTLRQMRRRS